VVVAAVVASTGAATGACGAAATTSVDAAATGAAGTDAAGAGAAAGATLAAALVLEPPPPPQATSVVPNAAIAATRIAKCWSGSVMAGLQRVTLGNKLLPQGISEGYAKAKLNDSKIKAVVPNFVQIQHNIVDSFTNIIRFESENVCIYIAIVSRLVIKKPPGGRFSAAIAWVRSM
jgi:hypothetical protein